VTEKQDFYYEADTSRSLSTEVVTAVAEAHDEDVIDQEWRISDDVDTDALDGLFQDNNLDTTLQFDADSYGPL
jgi:hypothetical protein